MAIDNQTYPQLSQSRHCSVGRASRRHAGQGYRDYTVATPSHSLSGLPWHFVSTNNWEGFPAKCRQEASRGCFCLVFNA